MTTITQPSGGSSSPAPAPAKAKVTYTGSPLFSILVPLGPELTAIPVGAVSGQATYTAPAGVSLGAISYNESNSVASTRLTSISFDDAVSAASLAIVSCTAVTSISFPLLQMLSGSNSCQTLPILTTFSFPSLTHCGGSFSPTALSILTTLAAPELVSVAAAFGPANMALLTTLSFPKLKYIGTTIGINTMASLATLSLPLLEYVGANVTLATMASLTTVSLPSMVTYGGTIAINTSLGNITSISLGTIGTLKSILGATINCSGQKLTAASVNAILALLVSLDGTGGTTLWGSGQTLTINGGTNSAPTGQGLVDKATLQARGATITTN